MIGTGNFKSSTRMVQSSTRMVHSNKIEIGNNSTSVKPNEEKLKLIRNDTNNILDENLQPPAKKARRYSEKIHVCAAGDKCFFKPTVNRPNKRFDCVYVRPWQFPYIKKIFGKEITEGEWCGACYWRLRAARRKYEESEQNRESVHADADDEMEDTYKPSTSTIAHNIKKNNNKREVTKIETNSNSNDSNSNDSNSSNSSNNNNNNSNQKGKSQISDYTTRDETLLCINCCAKNYKCDGRLPLCTCCKLKGLKCQYPPKNDKHNNIAMKAVEHIKRDKVQYSYMFGSNYKYNFTNDDSITVTHLETDVAFISFPPEVVTPQKIRQFFSVSPYATISIKSDHNLPVYLSDNKSLSPGNYYLEIVDQRIL